jgi:hypothetical protein
MLESLVCSDNGLSYLCGVIDPEILNEAGMDEADAPSGDHCHI